MTNVKAQISNQIQMPKTQTRTVLRLEEFENGILTLSCHWSFVISHMFLFVLVLLDYFVFSTIMPTLI